MSCFNTVVLLVFVLCNVSELFACCSVFEDDPRPREPKAVLPGIYKETMESLSFQDRFDTLLKTRLIAAAELRYKMLS